MMKGSMSTELGIITVNPEVIAKYAGSVAVECFGIVGMAAVNMKDGLVRLLKKMCIRDRDNTLCTYNNSGAADRTFYLYDKKPSYNSKGLC